MKKCLPRRSFIGIVGGTIVIVGFIIIFSDFEQLGRKLITKSLTQSNPSSLLKNRTIVLNKKLSRKTKIKSNSMLDRSLFVRKMEMDKTVLQYMSSSAKAKTVPLNLNTTNTRSMQSRSNATNGNATGRHFNTNMNKNNGRPKTDIPITTKNSKLTILKEQTTTSPRNGQQNTPKEKVQDKSKKDGDEIRLKTTNTTDSKNNLGTGKTSPKTIKDSRQTETTLSRATKNDRQTETTSQRTTKNDRQTTSPKTTNNDRQRGTNSPRTTNNDRQTGTTSSRATDNDRQTGTTSSRTTNNDRQTGTNSPRTTNNDRQTGTTSSRATKNDRQKGTTTSRTTDNDRQTGTTSPKTTNNDRQKGTTSSRATKNDRQTGTTTSRTTDNDRQTGTTSSRTTKNDRQTGATPPRTTKTDRQKGTTSPRTTDDDRQKGTTSSRATKNDRQTGATSPRTTDDDRQTGTNSSMQQKTYHVDTKKITENSSKDSKEKEPNQPKSKPKVILLWRELYKTVKNVQGHFTQVCPSCNCTVTKDRNMLSKADAVLFEVEGMYKLPRKPKTGQVWVYVEMESPTYMPNGVAKWDNLFNWTMTYRRDSDIQTFYGSVWPKEKKNSEGMQDFSKNKTSRMLWMVGHCKTPSRRENYVKELQQFMEVDTIGRCGKRVCGREKPCENEMLRKYKYYFAAENSDCRDYITEKMFRTMQFPILPVVRGGSNYSLYLPPKSYIDVNTFNKPENFAKYVKTMDENKDKYNEIFSWKNEYRGQYGVPDRIDPFCKLCDRLHNEDKYRRLYRSIRDWWRGNDKTAGGYFCPVNQLARL